MPVRMVTRVEWMAAKPVEEMPLATPIKEVLFLPCNCKSGMTELQICYDWLPALQQAEMMLEREFDVTYNWFVDEWGNVYEGRGWKTTVQKKDAMFRQYNGRTLDIGFIGTFKDKPPPKHMQRTATKLLELGQLQGFVVATKDLKIYSWHDFEYSLGRNKLSP